MKAAAARKEQPERLTVTGRRPPDMDPAEAVKAFARMLARHAVEDQDGAPKEG